MKFSLIVGTLNRSGTIGHCIESLINQTFQDFEIIVIDQSVNNETEELISMFPQKIIYDHVNFKGLSRARNRGLELATGDYICLIDDDAYYESHFLEIAANYLENSKKEYILSGFIHDTEISGPFARYKENFDGKCLPKHMVLQTCPSAGLVIPMSAFRDCGNFDENLGVGSKYGAGEETDFLLRALGRGYFVVYLKELKLKHPYPIYKESITHKQYVAKMKSYYMGIGALYKKHLKEGHEFYLIPYYIKLRLKFIIKHLFKSRLDTEKVESERKGFLVGLKEYPY